jgi:tetratricopeptide (TPR) repeat protein
LGICALLLLAVVLVFGQTVRYGFVNYDDDRAVYRNPQVTRGLSAQGMVWAFTHRHFGNWIPLTSLSHMLDCRLYGLNAGGHHLTNMLLHAATVVLLFLVLRHMTGHVWLSALVTALFAVHPLRVESVAWVTERKDVLSGLFFVLTLGAYARYVQHPFSIVRYLPIMIFFAMGLMAKPMLVTLPALLLLLDYWPLRRLEGDPGLDTTVPHCKDEDLLGGASVGTSGLQSVPKRFSFPWRIGIEKLPLLLLVGVSCLATLTQGEALAANERYPLWWRIGNALISYVTYLSQSLCPMDLAVLYPRLGLALPFGRIFAAFLVLAAITATTWVWRRRQPYLLVGWLWYLGMLVPVIGIVQIGSQAVADRFTYLPQIGLWIALVWGAAEVCRSSPSRRWMCGGASALVLAILMGCAWRQASFWHDSETLWTHTLACTSRNSGAHFIFATGLAREGRIDEALKHYRKAMDIQPDDPLPPCNIADILANQGRIDEAVAWYQKALKIQPDCVMAHNNLGELLARQGRLDEAAEHYRQVLKIQPDYAAAYCNLGNVWMARGQLEKAEAKYRKALEIEPDYAMARSNLGNIFARQGRLDEALTHYYKALEIQPTLAMAHNNLGDILVARGQFPEALDHYRQALESQPNDPMVARKLAWLRATCPVASLRNGDQAVAIAQQVNRSYGGKRPEVLDTLAAAYAEAGWFPEALATARKALELALDQHDQALADAVRARIALYEAGRPYRQMPVAAASAP